MLRKLLIGLVVGVLATGIFFAVAKADTSTTDGIEVGYKADLLAKAADVIDQVHELLGDLTKENGDGTLDESDGIFPQLVLIKDCKVGYLAALQNGVKFMPTDPGEAVTYLEGIITGVAAGQTPCLPLTGAEGGLLDMELKLVNISSTISMTAWPTSRRSSPT